MSVDQVFHGASSPLGTTLLVSLQSAQVDRHKEVKRARLNVTFMGNSAQSPNAQ